MGSELKSEIVGQLKKTKSHLEYSFSKVKNFDLSNELTEEQLESLESFSSRFARYSDILVSKYFRLLAIEKDPAFRGSVIDLLNLAEKYGWIASSQTWIRIRELRNLAAHEYVVKDYKALYKELIRLTPHLLEVKHQK